MATADSGLKPLQNAMKMAKTAIQLDGENKHKEAYCEYLRTINYISHALLEEAASQKEKEMVAVEVERMLRLAEQCLERAKSFIGKNVDPPDLHASSSSSSSSSSSTTAAAAVASSSSEPHQTTAAPTNTVPAADSPVEQKSSSPTKTGHRRVLSDGGGELSPFLPPEVFQRLQTVASQDTSKKELTPIEEASRLNQKLKATYEARLARLTPGQAYQKTSLIRKMFWHHVELGGYWRTLKEFVQTLSLQRQMMENLIIAKARQDALQRKMEERRLRLQEEANRRFAASGAMTAEEQEQRVLYANVLEYEQDHDWPKQWKANMKKNPDITLVSDLVSYLLSRSDHPVVKLLRKHQYRIYNRLYPIVSKGLPQSPNMPLRPSRSIHNLLRPETQRKPISSFSTDSSLSPSHSHELNTNCDEEEAEEPQTQPTVDRENSFEDLEQFLTQLDWAPPHSGTDETGSDSEPTGDPSTQDESHVQELENKALKEHLKAIVKDIHIAIEQLLSLCLLSFECLNTASYKDLCLASIEEAFFPPLWSAIVTLFRKVHREREQAFETGMKLYRDASPRDVGVPSKLFPPDLIALQGSYPYESAVQELKLLVQDCCPQRKLECIVRTLRLICACAEEYRCLHEADSSPKTAAIYLIGEEGYCLTSMQSALAYVESLQTAGTHLPAHKLV
uniref:VPS9 domain containing 1 n=1 Tax=Amphiprion percula TaxID=161767 RepID=A0A3P8S9N9_AMPPE